MKKLIVLALLVLSACASFAQSIFSDSVQISILTCGQGPEVYERFGHSGIRVHDQKQDLDIVFHYGVFSFDAPNFVWRFIKGETDYQIGAVATDDFLREYKTCGKRVTEQLLRLDKAETSSLINLLTINLLPQNRTYRYNYFYDNCATRPYNLLNKATGGALKYDKTWIQPKTYREMVRANTRENNWLDVGITLCIAQDSDIPTSFDQQMFLPENLATALAHCTKADGLPLVEHTEMLFDSSDEVKETLKDKPSLLSPNNVAILVLLASGLLLFLKFKGERNGLPTSKRLTLAANSFDTILLLTTGTVGAIIWVMNFYSEHPTVNNNLNCLWLWPTNLIFSALIWLKSLKKVHRIYFFINFAAILIYMICVGFGLQNSCTALMLFAVAIMFRDIHRL